MKKLIKNLIENGELKKAWKAIGEYEERYPFDSDICTFRYVISVLVGDKDAAYAFASDALRKMPYVADIHYNYAMACEANENWIEAVEHYGMARVLTSNGMEYNFDLDELEVYQSNSINHLRDNIEKGIYPEKYWAYIVLKNGLNWEMQTPVFHSDLDFVGSTYYDYPELPELYGGYARTSLNAFGCGNSRSTFYSRTETQRVYAVTNSFSVKIESDCYIPINVKEATIISVKSDECEVEIEQRAPYEYINYRFPKGSYQIEADNPFTIGTILPIGHDSKRKKLVLNIFVDGLSQTVLDNMQEIMPNTYRFFKNGVICKNAHTTADWTLPSVASVVTGQTVTNHQIIHSKLLHHIDYNTPILFEYFKDAGYNTTKIGGNWRIIPTYGYARGMDRVLYQHHYNGYFAENIISDVIDQIYEMRDTDQFIWMEIGELHQIADEINMGSCVSELSAMENGKFSNTINSVKQEYDPLKIEYYKKQIGKVDRKLENLYHYIEDNFSDDEIIVSLFADHGQGYLLKPEDEFLCERRSKVAFMFRGNHMCGETDEPISICDYSAIMCKMAGIQYLYDYTDAKLPVIFGGDNEREFIITESIHVGDPYQICLKGRRFSFYLKGVENVTQECRVPLNEYSTLLLDENGKELKDDKIIEYYTKICLEHIGSCQMF